MTAKELFKKVETYNEVAEIMQVQKARIYFTYGFCSGEHFRTFADFRKYVRAEFFKDVADMILKCDEWEDQKNVEMERVDKFGDKETMVYSLEIVSD